MMTKLFLSENDYYETRLASMISDIDREVLVELYQPLIGHQALALYLSLYFEKIKADEAAIFSHAHLFNKTQMSLGQILEARKLLEGAALLRSFLKEENGLKYYLYVLYAPKSPKDFFEDTLFKGLLIKYVGEKEAIRLATNYALETKTKGFDETTVLFREVFLSDLDDPAFSQDVNVSVQGRKTINVKTDFIFDDFFNAIESRSQYQRNIFLKKELKEIERIATLFGLNELTMAEIILEAFDISKKTERINFSLVTKRAKDEARYPFLQSKAHGKKSIVSGDSQLATKIKLMESVLPSDYLRIKQNNTTPSAPDLDLVNDLSKHFNLSNGVINALIDYVLIKSNNVLSRAFVEKIAASLAREGVETAVDAMNYLLKVHNGYKKQPTAKPQTKEEEVSKTDIIIEEVSEQEVEDIVNLIEKKKKKN